MNIIPIKQAQRLELEGHIAHRIVPALKLVPDAVLAVYQKAEVTAALLWLLVRASLDIREDRTDAVVTSLATLDDIAALLGRAGARAACPDCFDAERQKVVATVEFFRSHVTDLELPNPWKPGAENLTEQTFILKNLGEDFARELEIAARGGRTYSEEFARRDELRQGDEAKKFTGVNPYTESQPADFSAQGMSWTTWRAKEIGRIERENPVLARWLKKLAAPTHVNPFERGDCWNITKQMLVMKADGAYGALLKRTAEWRAAQLDSEAHDLESVAETARARAIEAKAKAGGR